MRRALYSTLIAAWLLIGCGPGTTAVGGEDETGGTSTGDGESGDGESGDGDDQDTLACAGTPTRVVDIAVANHSCALFDSGHVKCWGPNQFGQLGLGNTEAIGDDETPADIGFVTLDGCATAISVAAGGYSCAALADGSVQCWGRNDYGELGLGHTELPSSVGPVPLL